MDYNSLLTRVSARLNRTDLEPLYASFVEEAEEIIFARLAMDPVRPMGTVVTAATDEAELALPSGFIDVVSATLSDGTDTWTLVRLDPSDESGFYAERALPYGAEYDSSKTRHYSIFGDSLVLADAPDGEVTITLKCWTKPAALSSGNVTNWVIANHGIVYELGVLAMAYHHLRDDEAAADRLDKFTAAIDQMLSAYPERANPTELRAIDAPWAAGAWNIQNG